LRKVSDETKAKITASQKARHAALWAVWVATLPPDQLHRKELQRKHSQKWFANLSPEKLKVLRDKRNQRRMKRNARKAKEKAMAKEMAPAG
jgi:hypothetical protein